MATTVEMVEEAVEHRRGQHRVAAKGEKGVRVRRGAINVSTRSSVTNSTSEARLQPKVAWHPVQSLIPQGRAANDD